MKPLLVAPEKPISIPPLDIADSVTTRSFLICTMFSLKRLTIPAMFLRIGHQVCEALVPIVAGKTVDKAIATGASGELATWVGALAAVFLLLDVCSRFAGRLGSLATAALRHQLLMQLTERIISRRGFRNDNRPPGALLSVASTDATATSRIVMMGIIPISEVAALLFASVLLLMVSVPVGLGVLVGGVALTWGSMLAGRGLRSKASVRQAEAARAAATATDLVSGYRTLAGLGARRNAVQKYRGISRRFLTTVLDAVDAEKRLIGTVELLGGVFVILVAAGSGLAASKGMLTIGELITIVGLAQFITGPMTALGKNASTLWAQSSASAERVLALLREPYAVGADGMHVEPGCSVTIPSSPQGAGKNEAKASHRSSAHYIPAGASRVIQASSQEISRICSFLTLSSRPIPGEYFVGDVDLAEASLESVLGVVVVSPHEAELFDGTVRENLVVVKPDATIEELDAALAASGCVDVIEVLSDGLETRIGEGGTMLSGGQRQRVALARALLSNPDVLVLADPTTEVDSVTEYAVASGVKEYRKGRTTLVLSSSPAWSANMEVA